MQGFKHNSAKSAAGMYARCLAMLKDLSSASLILVIQAKVDANDSLIYLGTDAFAGTSS